MSLPIGELGIGTGTERDEHVKIGVLGGLAHGSAPGDRRAAGPQPDRRMCAEEEPDINADGVPDVYETDEARG